MDERVLEIIEKASEAVRAARAVAVLTGAGVSAESKIPTFRSAPEDADTDMKALWAEFDPASLATPEAFARDPELVTRWYDWRRIKCLKAEPNPGHIALARLEREITGAGGTFLLATQNVDGLHARAGSERIIELHGSINRWRCTRTGLERSPEPDPFTSYPVKTDSGGLLRPCVVWFGESLPEGAMERSIEAAAACDVFLTIGTSSVVYPAAGLTQIARRVGATTIEINPEATPETGSVDWAIVAPSGDAMPALVDAAFGTEP